MSQATLATALGVHPLSIYHWEREGSYAPPLWLDVALHGLRVRLKSRERTAESRALARARKESLEVRPPSAEKFW